RLHSVSSNVIRPRAASPGNAKRPPWTPTFSKKLSLAPSQRRRFDAFALGKQRDVAGGIENGGYIVVQIIAILHRMTEIVLDRDHPAARIVRVPRLVA